MNISRLQYITNYQSQTSHLQQITLVVNAGVKWVQYRPKEVSESVILAECKLIAQLCKQQNVTLIMNDKADVAKAMDADGVHLGKSDMSISKARQILGSNKIIGGTANTIDDIFGLVDQGVDYIGLGPFRFTQTKKNLSPVLGMDGYREIVNELIRNKIDIPVVAIGGITTADVRNIMNAGIFGIAVSSVICEAENITDEVEQFNNLISKHQMHVL